MFHRRKNGFPLLLVLVAHFSFTGCDSNPTKTGETASVDKAKADAATPQSGKKKSEKIKIDESINIDGLVAAKLPADQLDFGWIRLFDGQSLLGWKATSNANWHIVDNTVAVDSGDQGFLFTTSRFGDFELQLEFLASEKTNSGVFLRSPLNPTAPDKDCYEFNVAPKDNPFPTGSLVGRSKTDPDTIGDLDEREWHSLHALVEGTRVRTWVNGKEAVDYEDTTDLKSGYIGLQFREGGIQFRNVIVRPIGYSVLPAKSKDDWKFAEAKGFEAKIEDDGTITIGGAKGHAELLQNLDNFALQARVTTLVKDVNSGIFFRCIPAESMNGYECQINNAFDEDRRAPVDSGTGAIFRRQAARAVLGNDLEPTHLTIIADGPHIATWVEGVQVVDWTDIRPPKDNPREGLRTEAGTIQLQSHDPTTKARFETMSISPIP